MDREEATKLDRSISSNKYTSYRQVLVHVSQNSVHVIQTEEDLKNIDLYKGDLVESIGVKKITELVNLGIVLGFFQNYE